MAFMLVGPFFIVILLALSFLSQAQNIPIVRGAVVDVTGAAVPGVPLLLGTPQGIVLAHAITDMHGKFSLSRLSTGEVELVIAPYSGFAAKTLPIRGTDLVTNVTLVLKLQTVNQEVNVDGGKSLSTDSSANRDTVSVTGADLRKLPIFDQDPVAALTPFLDPASSSSGGVILIVDGIEMTSLNVSPSAIQEVRINNDPYSAEFNRPGRGRIEIITKPGSPNFHGEVNFTFRDAIFNAKNHFATVRPPESRLIYEGNLSGPVGRGGHSSFIISASRREHNTASIVDAFGPIGPIDQNVLAPADDMLRTAGSRLRESRLLPAADGGAERIVEKEFISFRRASNPHNRTPQESG